nr:SDR family oxidoreductase [Komarekiella delphini-convector]
MSTTRYANERQRRSAAVDYAKQGIRINAVNPGNIATEGLNRVFEKLGVTADAVTAMVLMGRIAQAEEVAQVVVFLCSDAASYITIDGGYTAN